jgi:hypothetical protein
MSLVAPEHALFFGPELATNDAAQAPSLRHVDGELYFSKIPCWGGSALTLSLNIDEVDPFAHTASGAIAWNSGDGTSPAAQVEDQRVEAAVTHIFFGADEPAGDPAGMVIVAQVLTADGGAAGKRGDFAYIWLRDGGPDRADQWGIFPYSVEPRVEFFPYDRSPAALGYFDVQAMQLTDPWFPLVAAAGDVVLEEVVVR